MRIISFNFIFLTLLLLFLICFFFARKKYDESELVGKGEPSSKAKYYKFSDSEKYCKGKVEKVCIKSVVTTYRLDMFNLAL